MADHTKIEWTEATWNPITGCSVVSPGCTNCYAMKLAGGRLKHHPSRAGLTIDSKAGPVWTGEVRLNEEWLDQPLRWTRPRMIFVCAHGDLFHEDVPDAWIDKVFAIMALSPLHTFQVLTKRADRMRAYMQAFVDGERHVLGEANDLSDRRWVADELLPENEDGIAPLPNIWLGVSAEDQARLEERLVHLLATPAAVRWLSAEPLLGGLDLEHVKVGKGGVLNALTGEWVAYPVVSADLDGREVLQPVDPVPSLDWVVVGGESGQGARPMHPDWPRQIRDACVRTATAFFFKQWGAFSPAEVVEFDPAAPAPSSDVVYLAADGVADAALAQREEQRGETDSTAWYMTRVGKAAAGRLLGGFEHNGMPTPAGRGR